MALIVPLTDSVLTSTLADLRVQLVKRGLGFLDAAGGNDQKDRLLNEAYLEICDLEDWPFLYATTTGTAPLTVSDLRAVTSVFDTVEERPLEFTTFEDLSLRYLDLDLAGGATHYWLDGLTTVKTWPTSSNTLRVRYVKYPAQLTDSTDEPLIPPRFRDVIVTRAAANAMRDESAGQDNQALEAEYARRLEIMRGALLDQTRDLSYIRVTGSEDWGVWA